MMPHFTLFLGRKSCPLSQPLNPEIIEATSVADAFELHTPSTVFPNKTLLIATDDRSDISGINSSLRHRRLDEPRDRKTWQFTARDEWTFAVMARTEKAAS